MCELKPCPFCGGPVQLEEANPSRDSLYGERRWWGVVCRNTTNLGGSCCMDQVPSASKEAAIGRWNRRAQPAQAVAFSTFTPDVKIAQAVRSKLGAGVPMRGDDIYRIARRLAPKVVDGMAYVPEWIVPLVRAVEESHGIVGKEGHDHG